MAGKGKSYSKFTIKMQKKLVVLFLMLLLAFIGLGIRLFLITRDDGEKYKKQVLSQQRYDSITIPYKRGSILDSQGSVLAVSEKVYNVILDTNAILDKEEYLEPTLAAIKEEFGFDTNHIRGYINDNPGSRYYVLKKRLSYDEISGFLALQEDTENNPYITGIWFEEEYKRVYPNQTLACDVIGFTTNDNIGTYGLEEYYNSELSGTSGREYGYLNTDSDLERTTKAAVDGNSIVTTIDSNIQRIVEKYLKKFDEEYKDNYREGNGAENIGCIIMEVDTGNILAMASYPNYDLNDTRNSENIIGMPYLDENGKRTGVNVNAEILAEMTDEEQYQHFNALWKNFCIVDTYEPGSVIKPFTVAAGIESGRITGNETYNCEGKLEIGGYPIHCHNTYGDGVLTVAQAVERSCNVCMMRIGQATGAEIFCEFQHVFNFGLKTNIDLAGEARTLSLIYPVERMGPTELATNTFGQGFNISMIQGISGFCSLVNGGYYYEPHMVSKIVSPSGATIRNIEPRVLKQTISAETSETIKEYCNLVVTGENGTGKTARPAGYMIGGKTGTAETLPRGNKEFYVVSFMGYAPADDPQIAIYVVVDRPNVRYQDDAKFATRIVRSILTETLPYLNIFMTEELSDSEREELEALQIEIMTPIVSSEEETEEEDAEHIEGETPENEGGEDDTGDQEGEIGVQERIWETFPIDPETGYAVDPNTGAMVDPNTGATIGGSFSSGTSEGESGETSGDMPEE